MNSQAARLSQTTVIHFVSHYLDDTFRHFHPFLLCASSHAEMTRRTTVDPSLHIRDGCLKTNAVAILHKPNTLTTVRANGKFSTEKKKKQRETHLLTVVEWNEDLGQF